LDRIYIIIKYNKIKNNNGRKIIIIIIIIIEIDYSDGGNYVKVIINGERKNVK
jgi:hypothetical protein